MKLNKYDNYSKMHHFFDALILFCQFVYPCLKNFDTVPISSGRRIKWQLRG